MDQVYLKATRGNSEIDKFSKYVVKLKTVQRQGWKTKLNLHHPESVADHSYSMAFIGVLISDSKNLDTLRIVKMILIHDLAEALTGDFLPGSITKSRKQRLEDQAMKKILKNLPKRPRNEFYEIWQEYTNKSTLESKLVHQIDKLEMAIQASEYADSGIPRKNIMTFLNSAKQSIKDPELKKILSKFL